MCEQQYEQGLPPATWCEGSDGRGPGCEVGSICAVAPIRTSDAALMQRVVGRSWRWNSVGGCQLSACRLRLDGCSQAVRRHGKLLCRLMLPSQLPAQAHAEAACPVLYVMVQRLQFVVACAGMFQSCLACKLGIRVGGVRRYMQSGMSVAQLVLHVSSCCCQPTTAGRFLDGCKLELHGVCGSVAGFGHTYLVHHVCIHHPIPTSDSSCSKYTWNIYQ